MALVWIREKSHQRRGSADQKAVREYTRSWEVLRDSMVDDSYVVLTSPGLPDLFELYVGADGVPDDLGATCNKIVATNPDPANPFLWEVVATYSNRTDEPGLGDPYPLDRPAEIEWDFEPKARVLTYDLNGKAVVNSAGEKFDPPVEVNDDVLVLCIDRNEAAYNPNLAQQYKNAVNSDSFYGAAPGYVQCKPFKGKRHYENNIFYYSVGYRIHFRGPGDPPWQPTELDQGYYELSTGPTGRKLLYDDSGSPMQSPGLLDGNGHDLRKAKSTLNFAVAANASQMTVLSFNFPPTYPFTVLVDNEQIIVTGNVGGNSNIMAITRGANGTVAAAHANGATVQLQPVFLTFQAYPSLPFAALNLV